MSAKHCILFLTEMAVILLTTKVVCLLSGCKTHFLSMRCLFGSVGICLTCQFFFFLGELYKIEDIKINLMFRRLLLACVVSFLFLQIIFFTYPALSIDKSLLEYNMFFIFVSVFIWRAIFATTINRLDLAKKIIIFGNGANAALIAKEILKRKSQYKLIGTVSDYPKNKVLDLRFLGKTSEIDTIASNHKASEVVVALGQRRQQVPMEALLRCKLSGVGVCEVHDFYEQVTDKILLEDLRPSWLIFSRGFRQSNTSQAIKRLFDILLAIVALVPGIPLAIITALMIKTEDRRAPVLFKQERVGKNNEVFTLFKFRSMSVNAELESGPVWAEEGDSRITRVGAFIRATRLDEIPQLLNVLQGNMSLVGPRPERAFFIEKLQKIIPYYTQRHAVKPGITGWAAVKFRYGATVEDALEKLQYDLYYIKNISLLLDIKILFLTIFVILSKQGSR